MLIISNSVAHFSIVFTFGRLVQYEIQRLRNFDNPLPMKSKMTGSGSKCRSSVGFRPQLHFSHHRFEMKQSITSNLKQRPHVALTVLVRPINLV